MTYMEQSIEVLAAAAQDGGAPSSQASREPVVVVVEDDEEYSTALRAVCDCLDVVVERMPSHDDLGALLTERRPMAVIAAMESAGQDGCHVLMTVAAYDRDLPVLLITNDDPAFFGAIEAVEEIWQLTSVVKWPRMLGVGEVVDFLFRAGRKRGCMRLMPL
jgi:response regulator RpfG family c-di-GMP phosphodiesterase